MVAATNLLGSASRMSIRQLRTLIAHARVALNRLDSLLYKGERALPGLEYQPAGMYDLSEYKVTPARAEAIERAAASSRAKQQRASQP